MLENGFIVLNRSILTWEHFKKGCTLNVFLYLILKARFEPCNYGERFVDRGQLLTNYIEIAESTGTSYQQVRTSLSRMKSTGEITVSKCGKSLLITVVNYNKYQDAPTGKKTGKHPVENRLHEKKHTIINNNNKESTRVRARNAHGCFKNVMLSDEEYADFQQKRPYDNNRLIDELSMKLVSEGSKYKNHYATLLRFGEQADKLCMPVEKKYKKLVVDDAE